MDSAVAISSLRYAASPSAFSERLNDEVAILHAESGKYFGLNAVGGTIWECLQSPVLESQIVERLCAEFEVERVRAEVDVRAMLQTLLELELIQRVV